MREPRPIAKAINTYTQTQNNTIKSNPQRKNKTNQPGKLVLTDNDSGSYERNERDIDKGGSKIVVTEIRRKRFKGKRVRVKRSREKSRGKKGISKDKKNRGREKEKGNQHSD